MTYPSLCGVDMSKGYVDNYLSAVISFASRLQACIINYVHTYIHIMQGKRLWLRLTCNVRYYTRDNTEDQLISELQSNKYFHYCLSIPASPLNVGVAGSVWALTSHSLR